MAETEPKTRSPWVILALIIVALIGGLGGWLLGSRQQPTDRKAIEDIVRNYILEHPEVLPQAIQRLEARENGKQVASAGNALTAPFPGAVLGNPNGAITLVEFTDYACTYCRQSVADVTAMIAANPDLRVVVREYPILIPESADAARMALAAAQQGRYTAFHDAMFRLGPPTAQSIAAAAKAAGVDLAKAQAAIATGIFDVQLRGNAQLASGLGISGTPGWVVGNQLLNGAVGREALEKAIAEATPS